MKRVNFFLTPQQIEKLSNESKESGLTVSEIIRRAVDNYVDKKDRDAKNISNNSDA